MDASESGADPAAELRAERETRGRQAQARAAQAGARADQLHRQHVEAAAGGSARRYSDEDLALSRQHVDAAEDRLIEAVERAAVAHDRAALLHERLAAAVDPDGPPCGNGQHAEQALAHRKAAGADRELGRRSGRRRDPAPG